MRGGPGFDWAVIEEAAHAWLSEIAVPLVQGDRWLLIGDHAQLPAHSADRQRTANDRTAFERPVNASRCRIQGIDETIVTALKHTARHNGRL